MTLATNSQSDAASSTPGSLYKAGALVVLALLVGFGALVYVKTEQREALNDFIRFARDQADWSSYQLETERFRLEIALANAVDGDPQALKDAKERYDIFASKLPVLRSGDTRSLLHSMLAYSVAVTKVSQFLDRFNPSLADGLDKDEVQPMLDACVELAGPLTVLSNATMHARTISDLMSRDRIQMFDRAAQGILLVVLFFIGGFATYAILTLRRAHNSERRLRRAQVRLRDFASIASDWYWETDQYHRLIFISEPTRKTSFQLATKIGAPLVRLLEGISANENAIKELSGHLASRESYQNLRYQARNKDGESRHLSMSGAVHLSRNGIFLGYRGTTRDITCDIVNEQALSAALKDAQVANEAKSIFLANMSHELRTPLNAIIGFSEMLQLFAKERLDEQQFGYLKDIQSSGRHLLGIINSILELAKMEVGRMRLTLERTEIYDITQECVRMLEMMARESGVTVIVDTSVRDLPWVLADRMRLRQVFLNLISNAIKYSPDAGCVRIEGTMEDGGTLRVDVVDEGIGMRPEDVAVALRPFERINSTYSRNREGVGLGLPIAESLVKEHGGSLSITSKIGRGTRISVHLPVGIEAVEPRPAMRSAI